MANNIEFDLGELGIEDAVRKYKTSKKRERKITEREFHAKKSSQRRNCYDDDDYEYDF